MRPQGSSFSHLQQLLGADPGRGGGSPFSPLSSSDDSGRKVQRFLRSGGAAPKVGFTPGAAMSHPSVVVTLSRELRDRPGGATVTSRAVSGGGRARVSLREFVCVLSGCS